MTSESKIRLNIVSDILYWLWVSFNILWYELQIVKDICRKRLLNLPADYIPKGIEWTFEATLGTTLRPLRLSFSTSLACLGPLWVGFSYPRAHLAHFLEPLGHICVPMGAKQKKT